jgi:hypothetical protein
MARCECLAHCQLGHTRWSCLATDSRSDLFKCQAALPAVAEIKGEAPFGLCVLLDDHSRRFESSANMIPFASRPEGQVNAQATAVEAVTHVAVLSDDYGVVAFIAPSLDVILLGESVDLHHRKSPK